MLHQSFNLVYRMNYFRIALICMLCSFAAFSQATPLTDARQYLDQLLDVQPHAPNMPEDNAYWRLVQKTQPFLLCRQQYFYQLWRRQAVARISHDAAALLGIKSFLLQPEGQRWASQLQDGISMHQSLAPSFYAAPPKNLPLWGELPDKQPTGKARRYLQQLVEGFAPEMNAIMSANIADMYQQCDAPLQALLKQTPGEQEIAALLNQPSQPNKTPPSQQALARFAKEYAAQQPALDDDSFPPELKCMLNRSIMEIYVLAARKAMPDADTVELNTRFLTSHVQQALVKYRLNYPKQDQNRMDYLMNQPSQITPGEWLLWLKYQEATPAGQRYQRMSQLNPTIDPDMLAIFKQYEKLCSQGG